jgi:histidinol-phosphate/aromatic aminotransferase/cobyric acid decarboxylase-like protein
MFRNEKTDDWPEEFRRLIFDTLPSNILQCYPDHKPFYEKLSKFLGLPETRFVVTSGIDEAAKSLLTLFCEPGDKYAAVFPGYAMYKVYGEILGAEMTAISYDPDNFMSPEELLAKLPVECKVLFLPNPSQPVENYFLSDPLRKIAALCNERGILLAVDEAYHFFGAASAIPLTDEFDNVIILRTFSKAFGGGGLRLGYAVGSENSIASLAAFRLGYEANAITYHIGKTLLDHFDDYVKESIQKVCEGRDYFREQCQSKNIKAWGRVSNFVLLKFESPEQKEKVIKGLDNRNILVRGGYPIPLACHLMVTCGPVYQMEKVFKGITDTLSE